MDRIASQQADLYLVSAWSLSEQATDTAHVLLGQNAGGGHDRGLLTGAYRHC